MRNIAPVAVLSAWLLGVAFRHRPPETTGFLAVLVLTTAYCLLAAATVWGLAWLGTIHRMVRAAGALLISPVFVWQFREVTRRPDAAGLVPLACIVTAALLFGFAEIADGRTARRLGTSAAGAAVVLFLVVTAAFEMSNTIRFEMLRYHTVLGFPAWALMGPPVASVEKELWDRHDGEAPQVDTMIPPPGRNEDRVSVVFILIDTLRRDRLEPYGGDPSLMPRLNALSRESIVFSDVLASATWTRSSIGSMFTGLYQEYHGAVGREDVLGPGNRTLAEILSDRGYETAAFVTNWSVVGRAAGFDQGFETFTECRAPDAPYLRADGLTKMVTDWFERRSRDPNRRDRPLFLYVHFLDPHIPYLSGGKDSYVFSKARRAYDTEVAFVDEYAGRLIRSIDQAAGTPPFLVVVADHGEEFGEHGSKGHGFTAYDEVARIPVLVRSPGGFSGVDSSRLEGRDLFDLVLYGAADPAFDPARWARTRDRSLRYTSEYLRTDLPRYHPEYRHVCLRATDHEGLFLIESAFGPTVELYDRTVDPTESRNLARRRKDRVSELLEELDRVAPPPWVDRTARPVDLETLEQLKALGYAGSDGGKKRK